MVEYSALDMNDWGATYPLSTDPLLNYRYGMTPEAENAAYWAQAKREQGTDKPLDTVIKTPIGQGVEEGDLRLPVWGDRKPAVGEPIPTSGPDFKVRNNEPISDAPPTGPPTYYNEDSFVPDRDLARFQKTTAALAPYATGNAVTGGPSSVIGVGDEMSRRIVKMAEAMPPDVREQFQIISGYRSPERQAQVNPGVTHSRHTGSGFGTGQAVDLQSNPVVLDWINKNPQFGLGFPLKNDPREINHLEMIDPNGRRLPMPASTVPNKPVAVDNSPAPAPPQTTSATAADRQVELAQKAVDDYTSTASQYPILQNHQDVKIIPGNKLEYWSPNEPGTPDRPRPTIIPIDQAGLEVGPGTPPMDILGDLVSHHLTKKDPVIKKYYEGFVNSLTPDQKEHLQAQYFYYQKNEGETRPYKAWEKETGLPAYFRGYAFGQWPDEFNQQAYTPSQRQHFDQMMGYLRGKQHSALEEALP